MAGFLLDAAVHFSDARTVKSCAMGGLDMSGDGDTEPGGSEAKPPSDGVLACDESGSIEESD